MMLWHVYLAAMLVAAGLRDLALLRAAGCLLANWLVLTVYAGHFSQYDVVVNMGVDCGVIYAGFLPVRRVWLALLVFSSGLAMIFHSDALIKQWFGTDVDVWQRQYWWRFHYLAWCQAIILTLWGGHGIFRTVGRRSFRVRDSVSPIPDSAVMGYQMVPTEGDR